VIFHLFILNIKNVDKLKHIPTFFQTNRHLLSSKLKQTHK